MNNLLLVLESGAIPPIIATPQGIFLLICLRMKSLLYTGNSKVNKQRGPQHTLGGSGGMLPLENF